MQRKAPARNCMLLSKEISFSQNANACCFSLFEYDPPSLPPPYVHSGYQKFENARNSAATVSLAMKLFYFTFIFSFQNFQDISFQFSAEAAFKHAGALRCILIGWLFKKEKQKDITITKISICSFRLRLLFRLSYNSTTSCGLTRVKLTGVDSIPKFTEPIQLSSRVSL